MELLKLLLFGNLLFIAVKAITGKTSLDEDNRIDRESIECIQYDIELITYINEKDYKNIEIDIDIYKQFKPYFDEQRANGDFIFQGQSTMFFRPKSEDVNRIYLHYKNLIIATLATEIIYSSSNGTSTIIKPRHEFDGQAQTVVLYFDDVVPSNFYNYRLIMKFVGRITDNTGCFFKTPYINDQGEKKWFIAAADFRGAGAREIFPCWDEPDIRTNFTISIKNNQKYIALSNSPSEDYVEATDDSGMVWTRFKTTYNISAYHVAVVLSDLYPISKNVWGRKSVESHIEFARKVAENATLYLKNKFHKAQFPPKVDHVVVPGFRDEGLESWGLVLYREAAIIYDEKLDSIAWKSEVARMVARKMVHQLYGNLISQSWWSYMWLNEGIASLLTTEIIKEYINFQYPDLFTVQLQYESLRLNDYYDMPLVSKVATRKDINSLFSFTYYVKAPAFVRVLEQMVSPDTFQRCLKKYLNKYQLRSIDISTNTADKFFDLLELLQPTRLRYDDVAYANLKKTLSEWSKQKRYPVLEMTRESSGDLIKIKLSQEYVNETYGQYLWIHVTYVTESRGAENSKWLSPHNPHFHLTDILKNDWIIVNARQTGYYRVNYDKDNWEKLMKYLNSEEFEFTHEFIHVLNRAQIIDDAYYFLLRNKLDFQFFKNLTYYLTRETDYIAWYPMFKIMEETSGFFPFPESTEIKEHLQKISESVLKKIGYTDKETIYKFKKCLRQEAAKWACNLDSSECTHNAHLKLTSLHKKRLSPMWKEWTYCKGLMSASNSLWNEVLHSGVLDNDLLRFLACTKNHTVIIGYLDLLKSGRFTKAQHRITVFHSIIARHARNELVLVYILDNFANVVPKEIKKIVALTDIINHLYSIDHLEFKVYNYVRRYFSDEMFSRLNTKIYRRLSQITEHVGYFKSFLTTKLIYV